MVPRSLIVNEEVTPFYHVTSRCVRSLFLLGVNDLTRKQWMEERLAFLSLWFSIRVLGYSFQDNEFHLIIGLETSRMQAWSDEEVVRRWAKVFTPREEDGGEVSEDTFEAWVAFHVASSKFVEKARATLSNLGCFMKCFKQPLSRMANREDGTKGAFFESRYKSVGILGDDTLITSNVFVDLKSAAAAAAAAAKSASAKPLAAPEDADFTGLHTRMEHVKDQGPGEPINVDHAELSLWLSPVSERIDLDLTDYRNLVQDVGFQRHYFADAVSPEDRLRFQRLGLDPAHIADEVRKIEDAAVNDRWGFLRGPDDLVRDAAEKMARLRGRGKIPSAPPPTE